MHESNSNFKGGDLLNRYDRKTREEAKAERDQKAASDTEKALSRKKGLKKAAHLENESQMTAKNQVNKIGAVYSAATAALPPLSLKRRDAGDAAVNGPTKKKKVVQKMILVEVSESEDDNGPEFEEAMDITEDTVTPVILQAPSGDISSPSGEEYVPSDGGSEVSSDGGEVELGDDDPDTVLNKQQKRGKKQKKGLIARKKVKAMRDRLLDASESDNTLGTALSVKSGKKSRSKSSKSAKSATPTHLTGVKPSWNEGEDMYHPGKDQPQSVSSSMSSFPIDFVDLVGAQESGDEGPRIREGAGMAGLGSEGDDEIEHQALTMKHGTKMAIKSIAKIGRTTDAPVVKKKNRASVRALPKEVSQYFQYIKIVAVDHLGQDDPWSSIFDGDLCEMWNGIYGTKTKNPISADVRDGRQFDLFKEVKACVNQAISSEWKNRLARAATAALESEFDIRSLESSEECANFVKLIMGANDRVSKKQPFLWRGSDRVGWSGEDVTKDGGLFLGCMVMRVLAEHFAFVSDIPPDVLVPSEKPRGALMMSILALLQALEYSRNGVLKVPKGRISFFSQENWGDYESTKVIDGVTKRVHVRQSTVFKSKIESLTDEHWVRIVEAAKSYLGKRKENFLGRAKVEEHPEVVVDDDLESDGELFDPMFDKDNRRLAEPGSAPADDVHTH
ncbi:hypothetical protein EST38_g4651 [Candolleomyces aberdarensis]|uniref:Uncharacterized protein n=1 Tax=Candolleomyces aberdarensis TaxID=2316362 RepID=A0A4Q2DMG5_9AGAR|nr:hypothetical protein EST38_g4651 [Candolleomyces aberdarensis]